MLSLTLRMFMGFDSGASKGRMKVGGVIPNKSPDTRDP